MLLQNQILCKNGTSKDINVDSTTIIEENSYYIFEDMNIHWEKAIVMNSNIRLDVVNFVIYLKILLVTDIYGC